ncbi:MAG: hypothetical protein KGI32_09695 [Gammaproteobacteria bacterium]|nr:hypothetical protein [Gammaproteobacteria bacterium]MDE1888394.1 hypothetical protein [Gammaproteobacteria bacterium]
MRLDQAAAAAGQTRLNVVTGEEIALRLDRDGAVLDLSDGRNLYADRVVPAVGHYPPADPPVPDHGVIAGANYVRDTWAPGALDHIPPHLPARMPRRPPDPRHARRRAADSGCSGTGRGRRRRERAA